MTSPKSPHWLNIHWINWLAHKCYAVLDYLCFAVNQWNAFDTIQGDPKHKKNPTTLSQLHENSSTQLQVTSNESCSHLPRDFIQPSECLNSAVSLINSQVSRKRNVIYLRKGQANIPPKRGNKNPTKVTNPKQYTLFSSAVPRKKAVGAEVVIRQREQSRVQ